MRKTRRRVLALATSVALLPLSACSDTGRFQLAAGPNDQIFRIDTATGDTWRTSGSEWVLVRLAPPQRR